MYCRTIEKFLKKTKAEVDPTEQLHQSHSQTYLLERLEQNKAWYHQISNGYSNTLLYPKSELHPTIYRHGEILQTLSMIEMQ